MCIYRERIRSSSLSLSRSNHRERETIWSSPSHCSVRQIESENSPSKCTAPHAHDESRKIYNKTTAATTTKTKQQQAGHTTRCHITGMRTMSSIQYSHIFRIQRHELGSSVQNRLQITLAPSYPLLLLLCLTIKIPALDHEEEESRDVSLSLTWHTGVKHLNSFFYAKHPHRDQKLGGRYGGRR